MPKINPLNSDRFINYFSLNNQAFTVPEPEEYFKNVIDNFMDSAIGSYFWYIADMRTMTIPAVGGTLSYLGDFPINNLVDKYPSAFFEFVHPEDINKMYAFTTYWLDFYKSTPAVNRNEFKAVFYHRLKIESEYKLFMVQFPSQLLLDDVQYIYGLVLFTDISHLNAENSAILTIINTKTGQKEIVTCQANNELEVTLKKQNILSNREIEVLRGIAKGLSSKQIAYQLGISPNTINNHRNNMRAKTNTQSSAELVNFAIKNGFL